MTRQEAAQLTQRILDTLDWSAPGLAHHLAMYRAQVAGHYEQGMADRLFKTPEAGIGIEQ